MRKNSINQITLYQLIGGLLNVAVVTFLINIEIKPIDFVATVLFSNIAYALVMREISIKHEQISEEKHQKAGR